MAGGAVVAWFVHWLAPVIGVLTAAVGLGIVLGNVRPPGDMRGHVPHLTKRLLRMGVALLGFSLSLATLSQLGVSLVVLVAVIVAVTLVGTTWLGIRLGLSPSKSLLLGTGFSICGASAIAAIEEHADASEDEVAVAIGMVTLFGTIAMVSLPLLQHALAISDAAFGVWAGASVHEVGQVVGAASNAGAAALALAITVKLTRVLMLAPAVVAISAFQRLRQGADERATLPPLLPMFVVAFIAFMGLRSTGWIPAEWHSAVTFVQQATLTAAMFGMGLSVRVRSLVTGGRAAVAVSAGATALITVLGLVAAVAWD